VFLDSGPNTAIDIKKRTEQAVEQSINYETNIVTDKVDKDMYFAGQFFLLVGRLPFYNYISAKRKSKDLKLKGVPDSPAEPGTLVALRNDPSRTASCPTRRCWVSGRPMAGGRSLFMIQLCLNDELFIYLMTSDFLEFIKFETYFVCSLKKLWKQRFYFIVAV
jgi:hypothetical protein